ncbi:hypothetical protein OB905_03505 [Halobacteria archaeon AArc-dxtr1]|nr:hypothetical protein [Halobacteria archaeon AArc-dxtr1]
MSHATLCDEPRTVERWDEVLEAIAVPLRRQLVVALLDAPSDEHIRLPEGVVSRSREQDREMVRQTLVHSHLPKLAAADFVRWDIDPLRAAPGVRFDELAAVVETLASNTDSLPQSLTGGEASETDRRCGPPTWIVDQPE